MNPAIMCLISAAALVAQNNANLYREANRDVGPRSADHETAKGANGPEEPPREK